MINFRVAVMFLALLSSGCEPQTPRPTLQDCIDKKGSILDCVTDYTQLPNGCHIKCYRGKTESGECVDKFYREVCVGR